MVPEAVHRSSSAMASYGPLSSKVFACKRIARPIRVRLFFSLVLSRLIYNVHVWSQLPRSAYNKLNAVYMRGLRRIADAAKFRASGHGTDLSVRQKLGLPSLQCIISQRRLLLLSSLLRFAPPQLPHLLSFCEGADRRRLPWTQLLIEDLELMASFFHDKLASLGPPSTNGEQWATFIRNYPSQWRQLVKMMCISEMPLDAPGQKSQVPSQAAYFNCPTC